MKKLIAAAVVSVGLLLVGCSGGGYGTVGPANLTMLNGNPGGSTPYLPVHRGISGLDEVLSMRAYRLAVPAAT